jgi:hypothetical protein
MTTPADSVAAPPSRFRFTLRTVLLACALVAVGMALWLSYQQTRQNELLRQENARPRNELGEILVEPGDENKLHTIVVPTAESMTWKWRLFIPAGRSFFLHTTADPLPAAGENPTSLCTSSLSPGEQTLSLALRKDYKDRWRWVIKPTQGGSVELSASLETAKLADDGTFGSTSSSLTSLTKVAPGQDLQLLRYRIFSNGTQVNSSQIGTAGPGVELWISEQ